MNYSGFGRDPSRISSFRPSGMTPIERMAAPQRARSDLQMSLGYRQTDRAGRERMEKLVGMGLPATTDINRVQLENISESGQRTYSAPRPMPFGDFGGMGEGEPRTPQLPEVLEEARGGGGSLPTTTVSEPFRESLPRMEQQPIGYIQDQYGSGASRQVLGFTGSPSSFTTFGQRSGSRQVPTRTGSQIQIPEEEQTNLSRGLGTIPRFPYSGY